MTSFSDELHDLSWSEFNSIQSDNYRMNDDFAGLDEDNDEPTDEELEDQRWEALHEIDHEADISVSDILAGK